MSPPDILQKIVEEKWRELAVRKAKVPTHVLESRIPAAEPPRGFLQALQSRAAVKQPAVIAEIKKASPSKGVIREDFQPVEIARSYQQAGAACLSVLTDVSFFQGADQYLVDARSAVALPVLRKDFTVDPYQVLEARCLGADCILLIAAILSAAELKSLHDLATSLGMDALVEVHDQAELETALTIEPALLGINNRNLRTFDLSLETTWSLQSLVPAGTLLVTESGIHTPEDVRRMQEHEIYSFLVGEAFMKEADPGARLAALFFPRN
ncbi:MAG: indole-3-glycerol phosphate synthase TrpC [Pseudomonadales bacterium]|nr:indole-3-glycerol phosphate synthase TrpC [Pseudomonadales bacterium]